MVKDGFGNGVTEKFATGTGRVKVVTAIYKRKITFVVKEARLIGIGERVIFRSSEIDQILKIKTDSFGFFQLIQRGEMAILDTVTKDNGIGSDGRGKDNFGVGKESFDVVNDGTEVKPVAVDA